MCELGAGHGAGRDIGKQGFPIGDICSGKHHAVRVLNPIDALIQIHRGEHFFVLQDGGQVQSSGVAVDPTVRHLCQGDDPITHHAIGGGVAVSNALHQGFGLRLCQAIGGCQADRGRVPTDREAVSNVAVSADVAAAGGLQCNGGAIDRQDVGDRTDQTTDGEFDPFDRLTGIFRADGHVTECALGGCVVGINKGVRCAVEAQDGAA